MKQLLHSPMVANLLIGMHKHQEVCVKNPCLILRNMKYMGVPSRAFQAMTTHSARKEIGPPLLHLLPRVSGDGRKEH